MKKARRKSKENAGSKVEDLLVPLTQDEQQDRAHRLATLLGELEALEARKKSAMADLGAEKKRLEAERSRLAGIVRDGKELRPIRVSMVKDFAKGKFIETRADTKEVVRSRALTREDRQLELIKDPPKHAGDAVTDKPPVGEEGKPTRGQPKASNVVKLSKKRPPEPKE